jgi:formate dehydrogenase iron-sulfur subunit
VGFFHYVRVGPAETSEEDERNAEKEVSHE